MYHRKMCLKSSPNPLTSWIDWLQGNSGFLNNTAHNIKGHIYTGFSRLRRETTVVVFDLLAYIKQGCAGALGNVLIYSWKICMHTVRQNILYPAVVYYVRRIKESKRKQKYVICPRLNRMAGSMAEEHFWLSFFAPGHLLQFALRAPFQTQRQC